MDGLVAQGTEAGGHARGTLRLAELLDRIRARFPDVLTLAAGGIADGVAAAAALRGCGRRMGRHPADRVDRGAHAPGVPATAGQVGRATLRTTAFGPEWPGERCRLLATPLVERWIGREDEIRASGTPAVIGRTRLFPHSANIEYEMPAFCSIPPTPETSGDWDAMAYPAG